MPPTALRGKKRARLGVAPTYAAPDNQDRTMPNKPDTSPATMTPRAIVQELDRHIVGQQQAKRAVAIALPNPWRRAQLDHALPHDVMPTNILLPAPPGARTPEITHPLATTATQP